jgi:hypothetical protein
LWVIALSLAVIAACLVVLVTRQQRGANAEAAAMPVQPETARPSARLPQAFKVNPGRQAPPADPPVAEVSATATQVDPSPEPAPVEPPAIPQPIVSSGFAPLTELPNSDAKSPVTLVQGRVILDGTPPPENVIVMDQTCGKIHGGTTNTTHLYAVAKDGGLADVFVYISGGLHGKKFRPPQAPVVLNQSGCFYEPYVFGLMTGQRLLIKNSDPVLHTVHIDPRADGGNAKQAKNFSQAPGAPDINTAFPAAENFLRIRCDVHPWMFSYACVVEHPFFAVTDAHGNFAISNVPPGQYTLTALHRKERAGEARQITVTTGETTTANFTIKAPPATSRVVQR